MRSVFLLIIICFVSPSMMANVQTNLVVDSTEQRRFAPDFQEPIAPLLHYILTSQHCLTDQLPITIDSTTIDTLGTSIFPDMVIEAAPYVYEADVEPTPIWQIQPIREQKNKTILFYVFLLITAILALLKNSHSAYLNIIQRSFSNLHLAKQFFNDYNYQKTVPNVLVTINVVLIWALLCFWVLRYLGKLETYSTAWLLLVCIAIVGIYLSIRRLMWNWAATILPVQETIRFFLFNVRIVNIILSIALLPLLLLAAFATKSIATIALYICFATCLLLMGYLYYRGAIISRRFIMLYKFHFIVYLCTFEIAPLIIAYKILHHILAI